MELAGILHALGSDVSLFIRYDKVSAQGKMHHNLTFSGRSRFVS